MPAISSVSCETEVLELFGGAARVSRLARGMGWKSVSLDKSYDKGDNQRVCNAMDINTDAGFLLLDS